MDMEASPVAAGASGLEQLTRLAHAVSFAWRRARRLLPGGPRRDVVVDHLIVAMELLHEVADRDLQLFAKVVWMYLSGLLLLVLERLVGC